MYALQFEQFHLTICCYFANLLKIYYFVSVTYSGLSRAIMCGQQDKNINDDIQEMPQSRSTAILRHSSRKQACIILTPLNPTFI